MQGLIKLELDHKEIKPVYGGKKILLTYLVEHTVNDTFNSYQVKAEVRGTNTFQPEIYFEEVSETHCDNPETVTQEALIDTLNDCTPDELNGHLELE